MGAAIPLVFVCAFGTALANEIGSVTIGFLVEVSEPVVELVVEIADDLLD
jgi:fluoride ion exporter CrcB/FEX